MAVLAVQNVTRAGLAPAYTPAAAGGDTFTPSKDTILHVKNGGAAARTITIVTPKEAFPGAAVADTIVNVPAGGERLIGPFPYQHYAKPSDGLANVTYDAVTSVTVAALQVAE
jgi:hypothetical protein